MLGVQVEDSKNKFSWLDVIQTPIQAKGKRVIGTPFPVEECLESNSLFTGERCLELFKSKGGLFHHVNPFSEHETERMPFCLQVNDEIRPSCSGGWCRSQTLYAKLLKYSPSKIILLHPHATRYGCDPYNDEVNWNEELSQDAFKDWAGMEKALRFGFEKLHEWRSIETNPTKENLEVVKEYYDKNYFGDKQTQNRRVFITFAANAHVILKRLNETNECLNNVVVVHIDLDDSMTTPYDDHISALSVEAFAAFSLLLESVIDVSNLENRGDF